MDPTSTEGCAVIKNVRKRTSKWDLVADTHFSTDTGQKNSESVKEGGLYHDKESNSAWGSSKSGGNQKWRDMEANRSIISNDSSERPYLEPIPEGRDQRKDGHDNRNDWDVSGVRNPSGGDKIYNTSMSPHHEEWRQGSHSHSPRRASNRLHRSRSRSPSHGFKRGVDSWNERGRSGSTVPCKDFAVGRCRRGSQCRYLHQDNHEYDSRRHHGGSPEESQRSRQDRRFPGRTNHGYGSYYDGDQERHESQRNSRSSIRCNDFIKGKCYRGSSCKYVHDSFSAEGHSGWSSRDATRERTHDRRDADISSDSDQRHGPRRNSETPCKYFAEGNCHNGENCRFSHQGPARGGLEHRSQDDKWGHSLNTGDQLWESSTGSHRIADRSAHDSPKQRSGNGGARANAPENIPWNGSKWGDKAAPEKTVPACPQWKNRNNGVGDSLPDDRSWNRWNDGAVADHVSNSLQWMSKNNSARISNPDSKHGEKFSGGGGTPSRVVNSEESECNPPDLHPRYPEEDVKYQILPKDASEVILPIYKQNINQEISGQEQHVSTVLLPAVAAENAPINQHTGVTGRALVFPCEEANQVTDNSKLQEDMNPENNFSAMSPVWGQSYDQNLQSQQMVSQPSSVVLSFNTKGQGQQTVLPTPNVQSFIPNGHSQNTMPQPPPNAHLQMRAALDELNKRPDLLESNVSQRTTETRAPNVVTSEQVAQLTNISASLAQILGNGKNLPELYASLNHPNATKVGSQTDSDRDSIRPLAPTTASLVQPSQGSWHQQQYDPICNSLELVKPEIDSQPPGFLSHSFEQKKSATEDLQAPLKALVQSSVINGPNDGYPSQKVESEEKPQHGYQEPEQPGHRDDVAKEMGEEATGQSKREQETEHPKDMETDGPVDEDNKKNKDAKVMRMFKFALVEFTKEILKPTWKEGHMSKEAHKTIVKKVVDKVTGAMQGPQIPQTQEKIDQYLSYSKPKLTKLVQAYVEKYLKT